MTTSDRSPGPGSARPGGARPRDRRALWRVAALAALAVHLTVLYAPSTPDTGGVPLPPWTDLVVHVAVFAALTAAALLARLPLRRPVGVVVGVMAAHAVISEVVQHVFYAHRSGDPRDVAADLAGVALGWAIAHRGAATGGR